VLLPRKLRETVKQVQPIECGIPWKIGEFYFSDLLRYVFMVGLITFACVYWLVPFHGHVEAAALALCAGNKAFTQTGGTPEYPTIVLLDNEHFIPECENEYLTQNYVPKYYLGAQGNANSLKDDSRKKMTLQYAFSGCSNDKVWLHKDNEDPGECKSVTKYFTRNLPVDVAAGGNPAPPQCKRFEPTLGDGTCSATDNPASCAWPWQTYQCEEYPPGKLNREACGADLSVYATLQASCNIWESTFNVPHPTANCLIVDYCTGKGGTTNCLAMAGEMALAIGNVNAYGTNSTVIQDAVTSGLATALDIPSSTVTVLQVRGFSYDWDALKRFQGPGRRLSGRRTSVLGSFLASSWAEADALIDSDNISQIKFLISSMPVNLIPSTIPKRIATLVSQMNSELGNGTVTSANFTSWPPIYATDVHVESVAESISQ